jgi:hypothetical protein
VAGLSPDQLSAVRDEVGPTPDDAALDDLYDRLGGLVGVVRAVWRARLAVFLAQPASVNVPGQVGASWGENIRAIERKLRALDGLDDTSDDLPSGDGSGGLPVRPYALVRDEQDR